MEITFATPDALQIGPGIYCKTPVALASALGTLRAMGYQVTDKRTSPYRSPNITTASMQLDGNSVWSASMPDLQKAKCLSCGSYITRRGIAKHGHTCEVCGNVTAHQVTDGTRLTFYFRANHTGDVLFMKAKRWDEEAGFLYLYPDFMDIGDIGLTGSEATAYLAGYANSWQQVTENGITLYKIAYNGPARDNPDAVIAVGGFSHGYQNYRDVLVWNGQEYNDATLPIKPYLSVYETWRWQPLGPGEELYRRALTAADIRRPDWYHSYETLHKYQLQKVATFIEHFSTLSIQEWRNRQPHFHREAPRCVQDIAAFCMGQPAIAHQPTRQRDNRSLGLNIPIW